MSRILALLLALVVGALAAAEPAPVLLVSLDGFRWDYLDKYPEETPRLRALRADGVATEGLIPVFPSNTFPNHYTLVTGLYPSNHGIVNNEFFDEVQGRFFRYTQPAVARDGSWWGGEPIWVTAVRQGRKAATAFWIGSEAEIKGVRPTYFRPYDYRLPFETRVNEVTGWLSRPPAERPAVVCFYFEETNSAGHRYGPDSPELRAVLRTLDERVGTLLDRMEAVGAVPNVLITSDHGMAPTSPDRVVILEDHFPPGAAQVESEGSVVALRPQQADLASLARLAQGVPHARAFRAEDLPPRLHVKPGPRVAPLWILSDEGWQVLTRANHENLLKRYQEQGYLRADHGFDPAFRPMHGILIGHGPAFRRGVKLPAADNIHVYNLLCALAGLTPAPNDGDDRLVRAALAAPGR